MAQNPCIILKLRPDWIEIEPVRFHRLCYIIGLRLLTDGRKGMIIPHTINTLRAKKTHQTCLTNFTIIIVLKFDDFDHVKRGVGPVLARKVISSWKPKKRHPIHYLVRLKDGKITKMTKEEQKLGIGIYFCNKCKRNKLAKYIECSLSFHKYFPNKSQIT